MANNNPGGVVTITIKANGSTIPADYQVYSISVDQTINRVATAVITLLDGDSATGQFPISASATFIPGTEITIEAGYDSKNQTLFSGIVVSQSARVQQDMGSTLEVVCKDKAVAMTIGRNTQAFNKAKDSDVISQLIGTASGVTADVTATGIEIEELVQYYATNWDFMLARAEVNSMVVSTLNNKVSVFNPTSDTSSVIELTYGDNILEFNADLNALTQLGEVKASAWDYSQQKMIDASASNSLAGPGNLSSKKLSGVVGPSTFNLQTSAAETNDELTGWAKAQMLKSELSKITGQVTTYGTSTAQLGKYLTLAGVSDRFNGDHFISSVHHEISDGNWISKLGIGLPYHWFVEENTVEAPSASGLLPGIGGLYNATVKKIDSDPDDEYRIQVDVPLFGEQGDGVWARLSNFYSTNGQGVFFPPEVGDEVILGFINQDPNYPVILGSMYSKNIKPYSDFSANEKNSPKGIVSKSELRVMFNDEDKILTIITPANQEVTLDDKNSQIVLKDKNSNQVTMDSSGIALKSPKNINIQADQKVSIKGQTGIALECSGGDVTIKGMNIKETADMQYAAKGSMTAEVQGGTELTLKAAMIMIN